MRFEKYEDARGEWRWRLVAANHRVVADGGEGYASEGSVDRALASIRAWGEELAGADIVVRTGRALGRSPRPRGQQPTAAELIGMALGALGRRKR